MLTTAKAPKADREILVMLQDGHAVPKVPDFMNIGETVHYRSDDGAGHDAGEVTIEFSDNRSPFLDLNGNVKTVITSNEPPIKLSTRGKFTCHCFITPLGKAPLGWGPDDPLSGGNHEVR
jgi:hypothetical protein